MLTSLVDSSFWSKISSPSPSYRVVSSLFFTEDGRYIAAEEEAEMRPVIADQVTKSEQDTSKD